MRRITTILVLVALTGLAGCRFSSNKIVAEKYETRNEEEDEKEDGLRESQEMDFEMIRDNRLGYIPAERLVRAYDNIYQARRAGRYPARLTALNWVERGPNSNTIGPSNGNTRGITGSVVSGRMRAVHVDLNDPTNKTVWAASVSGGLWKTTNIAANPANWVLVNDFLGNLAISSICQNPVNKNILYFATGERNGNIDAVRGGGVWKSINNGDTWELLPSTTGFWNVSKVVCDAAGNVYVGTNGNGRGLQRSTDGGTTWTNITPSNLGLLNASTGQYVPSTAITDIKVSSTGRMHVTMSSTGAEGSYYTDAPATVTSASWSVPSLPITNLSLNCEIAVAGNVLYALPERSGGFTPQIFKSTDGGVTWAATATSPPGTATEPTINAGQGWYDLAIGIDPANPDIVVAGGLNFYRTTDGGATWSQITRWVGTSLNYVHADHHGVFWNGSQVLLSTDGGIFYSDNNGLSYTERNVGIRTLQFYSCAIHPVSTNYLLGGTQDNGSHSLNNAGMGASIEVHGGDGGFTHIDEDEPQYQFSATTRSQYRRSVNNGVNWAGITFSSTIGQFINPTDYDDINNRMYCSAGAGSFVRWDNPQTGSSFTTVSVLSATSNSIRSFKVSPYTPNRVFMGTAGGAIVRVDNADAVSPTAVNITGAGMPQVNNNIISCVNTGSSDNSLIATYSNYGLQHVWYTIDGGTTWMNVQGDLPDIPVRWAMFHPDSDDKAIIATEMGIFETDNLNGVSTVWVQNSSFPNVKTNMLQYRYSDRTLLAATHGRGLWTTVVPTSNPKIRFASSYTYSKPVDETTAATDGCRGYRDITLNMNIDAAPAGNAVVTLSVGTGGSTAVEGVDYDITTNSNFTTPSKTLQFVNGSAAQMPVTVRIYDDAAVEGSEFFVINYSVGGSTNAIADAGGKYTVYIGDNDAAPQSSSSVNFTIGNGAYGSYIQPLRGQFAKSKSQYLYTAAELTAAGFVAGPVNAISINVASKATTQGYSNFNVSLKNTTRTDLTSDFETGTTLFHSNALYNSVAGTNTFVSNQNTFSWDGVSNLLVEFCFDNASAGTSSDGVTSSTTGFVSGVWARDNGAVAGCNLDASSTTLYRGVQNANGGTDYVRPDITINTTITTQIETVANRNKTNFVGGAGTTYFFSQGAGNLISNVSNAAASFGCVTFTIQEAGNTWVNYFNGLRSQKVIDVVLAANTSAGYTVGLYFTTAELGGKSPSTLRVAKTTAATATGAASNNTTFYETSFAAFGNGYLFTANVTGDGRYFMTDAVVTGLVDVTRTSEAFVKLIQNPVVNNLRVHISNEQRLSVSANLYTNTGQLVYSWNLGKIAGMQELSLKGTSLAAGTYVLRVVAANKAQSLKIIKQ
ncbi:putative secreted protein (Por secretion system target) [Lacibacter cauensis]|uniref:Putative secreted protein (Por secretion system target) n=1 Tax=Lacibacter cauensis TaxID=510947 RepID=A0A562SAE9_9BACT|nr:T9SS type A sorting domain-containing protein [Lacibacter cauensis]TWI78279.1 putative secreted protein (Por secretion system target) [Lacibacter cauensis]